MRPAVLVQDDQAALGDQAAKDHLAGQFLDRLPQEIEAEHLLGHQVDGDRRRQRPAQHPRQLPQAVLGQLLDLAVAVDPHEPSLRFFLRFRYSSKACQSSSVRPMSRAER